MSIESFPKSGNSEFEEKIIVPKLRVTPETPWLNSSINYSEI